jgi:hypothetical protein
MCVPEDPCNHVTDFDFISIVRRRDFGEANV